MWRVTGSSKRNPSIETLEIALQLDCNICLLVVEIFANLYGWM
jgi:hypothetical protein